MRGEVEGCRHKGLDFIVEQIDWVRIEDRAHDWSPVSVMAMLRHGPSGLDFHTEQYRKGFIPRDQLALITCSRYYSNAANEDITKTFLKNKYY